MKPMMTRKQMEAHMQDQYGVEGKKITPKPNTKGHPVKPTDGKANLGTKVKVHRAGK